MTTCSSRPRPTWSTRHSSFGPRELRNLGRGVLEHLAPEIADEAEYQRLLAEEEAASAATRLSMRRRGDGSTDIRARVPDHAAGRLSAYLNAYTAPRRHHDDEVLQQPIERRRGEAFVALLENIPTDSLPRHGGTATTVTVTLDLDPFSPGSASRPPRPATASRQEKPDGSPARPGSSPSSSAGKERSSTSAVPDDSSRTPSARPSTSATRAAPRPAAPCPPRSARPTTSSPGAGAARPASTTQSSCARSTTTEPTIPRGRSITTPTARPASPDRT